MRSEVVAAIDDLKRQFPSATVIVREDSAGGAYVLMEKVSIGSRYTPSETWLGFHIPSQFPYADIYPVFMSTEVSRTDHTPFAAPVTPGHHYEGRPAIQISRRSSGANGGLQKASAKILKILHFLDNLP
jgi:hypothetical protein